MTLFLFVSDFVMTFSSHEFDKFKSCYIIYLPLNCDIDTYYIKH